MTVFVWHAFTGYIKGWEQLQRATINYSRANVAFDKSLPQMLLNVMFNAVAHAPEASNRSLFIYVYFFFWVEHCVSASMY